MAGGTTRTDEAVDRTRRLPAGRLPVVVLLCTSVLVQASGGAVATAAPAHGASGPGYWLITGYGTGYAFGAPYMGSPESYGSDQCVNTTSTPPYDCDSIAGAPGGTGYWIGAGSTVPFGGCASPSCTGVYGTVSAFGVQVPSGPGPSVVYGMAAPVVGVAAAPRGAWLAGADGGVFAMAGAPFLGSMGGSHLDGPIVGIAATPDGGGYWEVSSDGGVFAFGDAGFEGSMGGRSLDAPVVGMASTADGRGYWLVASDGGVFAFGDAAFDGSMGGSALAAPMSGIAADPDGPGYWMVASDGGVFAFGDAPFLGSAASDVLDAPVVGIAAMPAGSTPVPNPHPVY